METSKSDDHQHLGPRYARPWGAEFWAAVERQLAPGIAVLDVGSGRRPTIAVDSRPSGCRYVGLDVEQSELEAAPPGSYDETVVADIQASNPELTGRFDLIVAWQVLEHVRDMRRAGDILYSCARPGGMFVTTLSGRNAIYALANRALPASIGGRLVARLRDRPRETVFPAHYDRCTANGLRFAFARWEELEVIPLWHAADYFDRVPFLQKVYLRYEDILERRHLDALATNYVVVARRAAGL